VIVRDMDCRGLALIVNPTSARWEFAYRPRGTDPRTGRPWPNRTITIGHPEDASPADARAAANRIKGQLSTGIDPVAARKAREEADRRKRANTLSNLADVYAVALPKRPKMRGAGLPSPRYVAEEVMQLRLALADMDAEEMAAADLGVVELKRLIDGGVHAWARFGAASRFLDWCQDAGHIEINPCTRLARSRRPRAPQARAHYLKPQELARLWKAAECLREPVWRDFVRFLIAVPCRRGEAAHLDWAHIDLDAAEWCQPGKMTKNGDPHRLHMHPLALDVLHARKEATGGKGLVFPAPISGRAITTFSAIKEAVDGATVTGAEPRAAAAFRQAFRDSE
jgi:integrase